MENEDQIGVWYRDTETNTHYLPINMDEAWAVWLTPGGDYAMTLHDDRVGHGEDVEYFDNLRKAKREAEKRYKSGYRPEYL